VAGDGTLPLGFCCVLIFCQNGLRQKDFDVLYNMRYICWVAALLGACDIIIKGLEHQRKGLFAACTKKALFVQLTFFVCNQASTFNHIKNVV